MSSGIYTTKWFLQCFIDRVSVELHSSSSLDVLYPVPDTFCIGTHSSVYSFEHETTSRLVYIIF